MQNRVEPPILLSRLLTFILAVSVVVLFALGMTLKNMFPLNRPQVFFLTSQLRDNIEAKVTEMPATDENMDRYVRAFIREYIRARNEIFPNAKIMEKKWSAMEGLVKNWSTDNVYKKFSNTAMVNAIRRHGAINLDISCQVEYLANQQNSSSIQYLQNEKMYQIKFRYLCTNNAGPLPPKDYTITLKLVSGEQETTRWKDRVENPLGLRVSEYKITAGGIDPLDGFMATK